MDATSQRDKPSMIQIHLSQLSKGGKMQHQLLVYNLGLSLRFIKNSEHLQHFMIKSYHLFSFQELFISDPIPCSILCSLLGLCVSVRRLGLGTGAAAGLTDDFFDEVLHNNKFTNLRKASLATLMMNDLVRYEEKKIFFTLILDEFS